MKAQFYSYPNGYHHTLHHHHNNNNNYSHNNNEESQQSDTSTSITDLSVLSPNLKSYLDRGTSTSNNCNSALDHNNGGGDDGAVLSPILPNYNANNYNNNNEQEVYSPHMAALTSPPTMHYGINNDGLLHSIFSAKKNRGKRRGRRRVGGGISKNMSDNMSGDKSGARGGGKSNYNGVEEEEEDVLGMFSPGIHEFDIDEALAHDLDDEGSSLDGFSKDGGNDRVTNNIVGRMNDDEVTLDSVDRIVRGDYLKRNQIKFDNGSVMRGMGTSPMTNDAVLSKSTGGWTDGAVKTPIGRSEEVNVSPGLQQRSSPSNHNNNNNTTTNNNYVTNSINNSSQEEQEQFYTPIQQKSNRRKQQQRQLSTTSSRGTTKSKSSSLAPLWEEKEITTSFREEEITPPFKTPKEFHRHVTSLDKSGGSNGMHWNVVQQEEEEEEFFSPMAQHHHHVEIVSPIHHQQEQQQWDGVVEESCNGAVVNEWRGNDAGIEVHAANEIDRSNQNELQQQQTHQQKEVTSPPMTSPQYSEMRQELQQMLVEARKLTPSKEEAVVSTTTMSPIFVPNNDDDKENIQPVMTVSEEIMTNTDNVEDAKLEASSPPSTLRNSINASPPSTTPNSHRRRHESRSSPPTPNLLPEHLTLDYVKECTCYDTLQEILTRLSSQEDGGSGGKRLRYPSMVRYVEKRMRVLAESFLDEEEVEVLVDEGLEVGDELVDDGDVLLEGHKGEEHREHSDEWNDTLVQDVQRSVPPALETDEPHLADNNEQAEDNFRHRQITPEHHSIEERSESIMTHETSLDMNLSESLEDESFFWKQDAGKLDNLETWESTLKSVEDNEDIPMAMTAEYQVDEGVAVTKSSPEDSTFIPPIQNERYIELEEKLSKSVAAQAELTIKIESLMKEHDTIKAELTSKLDEAREALSQQRIHASNEKEEHSKNISELRQVNQRLQDEISSLKIQLGAVNKKANDAARQLELELEERKLIESKLSQENERLGQELDEARLARDRAAAEESRWKEMLNEHIANSDEKNNNATKRFKKGLEAAKFDNHALANALAISEKDLSEALRQKEKSARECNTLQQRVVELEDKSSWLSSKVNTMTQELESSRKYIDTLYADLQSSRSPSKEMKEEMERKELQWLELERQYTNHIRKLEGQKISRADYVAVLRQSQKHQSEAAQKQQVVEELQSTITSLEQQIESMSRRPPSRNNNYAISKPMTSRGKSTSTMRSYGKKVHNVPSRNMENDENKAPSSDYRERVKSGEVGGKKMTRSSALKAVGGRKGLSEQLRRARRSGEETR